MGRAHTSAATCRDAAWETGEVSALVAGALSQSLDDPSTTRAIVESVQSQLITSLDQGVVELAEVVDGLDTLWAVALGIGHDAVLAEEIAFAREGLEPGPTFAALGEGNPRIRDYMRLDALIAQLQEVQLESDPIRQGTLLMRLHFLAAGSDAPEFRQTRSLVDLAGQGGGGALLSLVLHRVDRAHVSGVGHDEDALSYLTYLSQHPTDATERSEFMLRMLALANDTDDPEVLRGAAEALPSVFDRSDALIERTCQYVGALRDGNNEDAALIATEHGDTTTDTALAVAWHARALVLQRRASASRDVLKHTAEALYTAVAAHSPYVPAVAALANDVILAALLRDGDIEAVRERLGSSFKQDGLTRLRVLMCGAETQLDRLRCAVHGGCDNPMLISVLASRAEPAHEASLLLEEAIAVRAGRTQRVLREVKLYLDLFRLNNFEGVLHDATVLIVEPNPPVIALWAGWMAAHHLGRLQQTIPQWQRMLRRVSGEMRLHLHAAIAESFVALRMAEHAEPFLEALPDELWREAIRGRLRRLQPNATATGSWAVVSDMTRALVNEPRLLERMQAGRAKLKSHDWGEAATAFGDLGRLVKRNEERYQLFIVAGRSAELDPDVPDAAEGYYRRAIDLDATRTEAWDRLLALLVRRRDLEGVARACADVRGHIGKLQTMHLLLEAARSLASASPTRSFDIYRFLLLSMPLTPAEVDTLAYFEGAFTTAVESRRLEELHALLQRLTLKHGDTALLPHLDEWTLIVRERLGFETDLLSLVATARDQGCQLEHLERIEQSFLKRQGIAGVLQAMEDLAEFAPDTATRDRVTWFAAEAADRAGDEISALRLCQQLVKQSPRFFRAHLRLADYHQDKQSWEEAVTHLEAAARLIRDVNQRADVYYNLGDIYVSELGESSLALESFLVSFICDSGRVETLERLEALYTEMGRFRDLAGSYEIALQHAVTHPDETVLDLRELYTEKARIEIQELGDPRRAAETLHQAIRQDPGETEYLRLLIDGVGEAGGRDLIRDALNRHLATLDDVERAEAQKNPKWSVYLGLV